MGSHPQMPRELRKIKSLVELKLSDNPLTSPPAALCIRGRTHIFKYLERQAAKHERARGGQTRREPLETLDTRSHRRHNVDSDYSTSEGLDKRWSQEINSAVSLLIILLAFLLSYRAWTWLSSLLDTSNPSDDT